MRCLDPLAGGPVRYSASMTRDSPDLDIVVLGGGGHVGLPLSLVFAQAGHAVTFELLDHRRLSARSGILTPSAAYAVRFLPYPPNPAPKRWK